MIRRWTSIAAIALLAAGCAEPRERTTELSAINQNAGYRYGPLEQAAPKRLKDTFVVASFSGGGTRAAALAYGALKALEATRVPVGGGDTLMADEIDMISSVSGGSVTAAIYGLKGRAGLPEFERGFLKHNVQRDLILDALNPVTLARLATPAYARIDALRDYFDQNLFAGATYRQMLDGSAAPAGRRPYVVLNAADMSTGAVFSFNQDQFDLICSDLAQLKIADAVAASAAFPVALTALTLKNRSPCDAQKNAPANTVASGWTVNEGHPRPRRIVNDLAKQAENPGRWRRGHVALGYLNEQNQTRYVQLLDGGIADNLGLTEPLTMMTSLDRTPSILSRINRGTIKHIVVVMVNARSEADKDFALSATPPGVLSTLTTTIGTPIDGTSFLMIDNLANILSQDVGFPVTPAVVPVDFDFIPDDACRRQFKNLSTSWALADDQIDGLTAMGEALVRASKSYRDLVATLHGTIAPGPSIADACAKLAVAR